MLDDDDATLPRGAERELERVFWATSSTIELAVVLPLRPRQDGGAPSSSHDLD